MTPPLKNSLTILILASFLAIALFGFASMAYTPDGSMASDCMFGSPLQSDCPASMFAVALHHVGAYLSFLAAQVGPLLSLLLLAFLPAILVVLPLLTPRALAGPPLAPPSPRYGTSPRHSSNRAITRWLALFEHSPSHA